MITRIIIAVAITSFLAAAIAARASEHPAAHPPTTIQAPASRGQPQAQAKEVSKADISTGIKKHIASDSKKSIDRKFHTKYKGKDLALDLVKVHDDRVSTLGNAKYFACVDMKAADGTAYDLDFFLTGNPGDMRVTETAVHKINGKALYNWKEENGLWKKVKA